MHSTLPPPIVFPRLAWPLLALCTSLFSTGLLSGQTLADLSLSALSGKTLTCTIDGGAAPFETTGVFSVQIDVPAVGQYTIASSSGSTSAHTGSYQFLQGSDQAYFKLLNYFADGSSAEIEFFRMNYLTAGKNYFEMFNGASNKNGSYVIGTGSGGGGGGSSGGSSGGGSTTTNAGRMINMSVRAAAGTGDQTLIVGFVVGGDGTSGAKSLLIRAAGPSLAGFGLSNPLADPRITTFTGSTADGSNDNWADDASIASLATNLGAFPFTSAQSKDAAILTSSSSGAHTVHINGGSGVALAEIYDATSSMTSTTPRLLNVSARSQVGTGDNILIAGFVVGGSTPRTLLIRAVGPSLASLGVGGVLADPQISLYAQSTKIAENDNWGDATNATQIVTTSTQVGAAALPSGSKDAVILTTLNAGVYTVLVTGVGNTTGVALVELFEVP
jgi:hypothetical protein